MPCTKFAHTPRKKSVDRDGALAGLTNSPGGEKSTLHHITDRPWSQVLGKKKSEGRRWLWPRAMLGVCECKLSHISSVNISYRGLWATAAAVEATFQPPILRGFIVAQISFLIYCQTDLLLLSQLCSDWGWRATTSTTSNRSGLSLKLKPNPKSLILFSMKEGGERRGPTTFRSPTQKEVLISNSDLVLLSLSLSLSLYLSLCLSGNEVCQQSDWLALFYLSWVVSVDLVIKSSLKAWLVAGALTRTNVDTPTYLKASRPSNLIQSQPGKHCR